MALELARQAIDQAASDCLPKLFDREHTTCGHPVPSWHEKTWGVDGHVFCSLQCMANAQPVLVAPGQFSDGQVIL